MRQELFDFAKAKKDLFRGITPKLYPKWTQIYAHALVEKVDFDEPPEEVARKATSALTKLFAGDIGHLTSSLRETLRLKS